MNRGAAFLVTLLIMGCGEKEDRKVLPSGNEKGVRIEVLLVGGGSATLVCPKYISKPIGVHGRECYLDRYD